MNPLATYLRDLRDIRSSGANVPETSFYGPLANLLNEIGRTLKPRVRCIINPKNQGAVFLMVASSLPTNCRARASLTCMRNGQHVVSWR